MTRAESLPLDALTTAYDLGPWESVRLLPGGKSQHYHVVTPRGAYVVRRSYRSKTWEALRFEHELMAYLRRHGFPVPEVVPCVNGDTAVAVDGRLYRVTAFVKGSGYQAGNVAQLQEVARALAAYHRLAASFRPSSSPPPRESLNEGLRGRLAALPSVEGLADLPGARGEADPQVRPLLQSLPYALAASAAVLGHLDRLYPSLPRLTIHAGCRRGSVLFTGDRLLAVLDFDSAHDEARVLDLAVALHDFAKVYGDPASSDYKVPLDLDVVARFLGAYLSVSPLSPAEREALPMLLAAKRLNRALGRYRRLLEGSALSPGDTRKIALELTRVRWLEAHREQLRAALAGVSR